MGSGLKLALVSIAGLAAAAALARAQDIENAQPSEPPATASAPPAANAVPVPPSNAAPENLTPPAGAGNAAPPEEVANGAQANLAPSPPPVPRRPPPPPPAVVRSPVAIMQALDKVTAETMRFAAPVDRDVRYKSLIISVKACETRDLDTPEPKTSAYVVITSSPPGAGAGRIPPPKEVFHGWMFARSPSLDPFQHPIYDTWLIACSAAAPSA